MVCQHENHEGVWYDYYDNGNIIINQGTGEIAHNEYGNYWADVPDRVKDQILATETPFVWEWIDKILLTSAVWYGKYGTVLTNLEGILVILSDGRMEGAKWTDMGFTSGPGLTPDWYYNNSNGENLVFMANIGIDIGVAILSSGASKATTADKVLKYVTDVVSGTATLNRLYNTTPDIFVRDRISDAIFHARFGPNAGWDYENGKGVITQEGLKPYSETWTQYWKEMGLE